MLRMVPLANLISGKTEGISGSDNNLSSFLSRVDLEAHIILMKM